MNWLKKLWAKITGGSKTETPKPVETVPTPVELPTSGQTDTENSSTQMDTTNDGSPSSPDWSYIADHCWLDDGVKTSLKWVTDRIAIGLPQYKEVERLTGVPWYAVALIHLRECSLKFDEVLHNGEKLANVNKYGTQLVPKGRGKGKNWTWIDSAVDALELDGLTKVKNWDLGTVLSYAEKFNGLGYRKKIGDHGVVEYSPYITAGTNWSDETGKYVRDGVYSPTAREDQLGVLAVLIGLGLIVERKPVKVEELPKPVVGTSWIDIAKKELGVTEISGSKDNPRIVEYHASTTLKATDDETPWCSAFVSWCLEQAGVKSTKSAWARSYLDWGKKISTPVVGCVVVFSRGSGSGHVAFYMGETDSEIKCLGGNQGNTVCVSSYPKSRVLGYRLPV